MNMRKLLYRCSAIVLVITAMAALRPSLALAGRGNGPTGVIYVVNQDLFFDTIGLTDLPVYGPFQPLCVFLDEFGEIAFAMTDFGPGDPGYVGGRWEAFIYDVDMNLVAVRYFECPLLGPGRENP